MMEQPVTADQPPSPGSGGQEPLSFMDKAAGVFYEPSRVFESLKTAGVKFIDWFVPVLLLALLTSVATYVRLSSPDLRFQVVQQQEAAIDKMVTEGKMTADQAQQAKTTMEDRFQSGSVSVIGIGVFTTFVFVWIIFFIISGIWLLVGKYALKGTMTYTHVMGIVGLSEWIALVGVIIGTVMSVVLSRLDGGLQLGMLTQMNTQNKTYQLLSKVDLFTLWSLVVVSIGLAKIAGKKVSQSAIWVFGIWLLWSILSIFVLGGMLG